MDLIDDRIEGVIREGILEAFVGGRLTEGVGAVPGVLDLMYASIPDGKRLSYGRYTTIKALADYLFYAFGEVGLSPLEAGGQIIDQSEDYRAIGVGLGILALYGLEDFRSVLPYFETAAGMDHWEPREHAQGLFRKVIKAHKEEIREFLLRLVQSEDPNLRRFVSETLRPVVENQWLYKDLDYCLSILRHLFKESHPYPRTSVGNNLSDIARREPELVYGLVRELVRMEDKNATWIATRACRNLVKQDPVGVMDLLGVEEYKYKERVYRRSDTP